MVDTFIFFGELLLLSIFIFQVGYLLVFSVASVFPYQPKKGKKHLTPKITILIPAYQEDKIIIQTVKSALKLDYPSGKLTVSVGSDQKKKALLISYVSWEPW
jgi:cellulose synthase/poly-beta-1,6-N-acetylglucosamine synthase-like glycosyltransferase